MDALLLVAAVALAFFLLQSAVAHPRRLVMVSDSARFDADAALYNTRLLSDTFRFRTTGSAQGPGEAWPKPWPGRRQLAVLGQPVQPGDASLLRGPEAVEHALRPIR
mgnify:CR=1 FL=1